MAVTAPTAPTPPVPPKVPSVTLGGGGSVTESTVPPDGTRTTTGDEQNEALARQSVADGNGALAKTVQSDPKADARQAAEAAQSAGQTGREGARAAQETGQQQTLQASQVVRNPGEAVPAESRMDNFNQAAEVQAQFPPPPEDYSGGHGPLYWGVSLAMMAVLSFFLLKSFLARKGRAGELTKAELDDDGFDDQESRSLRGLKPDEVLARLEGRDRQERGEPMGTPAQEALRQAAPPPRGRRQPAPKATASVQGARQIAREYRAQNLAEPPVKKPGRVTPKPGVQEEQQHFEVRV